jgi:hypothetical protein
MPETIEAITEDQLREQLIADEASLEDADKILDNFRLLWNSYDTLTEGQKKALEQMRLDEENFFERRPSA